MMKRLISCVLLLFLFLSLAGCGGSPAPSTEAPASEPEAAPEPAPELEPEPEPEPEVNALDLTGQWKETDPLNKDMYYGAVIGEDKIELYRVSEDSGSRHLYWAGTYVPPERDIDSYFWTSQTGWHRVDRETIAADKETLDFTYQDSHLSYYVMNDGIIKWVEMEREEWAPGLGISNVPDELKSGFDPATNQTYTIDGVIFSFPSYFNVRAKDDSADYMHGYAHFYPEGPDTFCSLMFWAQTVKGLTQGEFDETKVDYSESMLENVRELNVSNVKSDDVTIAGLSGRMYSYNWRDVETEVYMTRYRAFFFNPAYEGIITVTIGYDNGDMSGYDYAGDFQKILDSAQLAS